jgi:hypothetical protein
MDGGNAMVNLARLYHNRWPDCLQISLQLAKGWMENGQQDEAVNLLHECASLDPVGQVPQRLWGTNFEFKPLYPEKMQIIENFAIPAQIATKFGMNHLYSGQTSSEPKVEPVKPAAVIPVEMIKTEETLRTEVHSFDGYSLRNESDYAGGT